MVRTRFAPSPTGYLHIGGVRTALFNWLFARKHGGQFLLRIDDTDQQRNVEAALKPILDGFRWLGIDWDEGPEVGGPHAPYYQSQRSARYQTAVDRLLESGAAYRDFAKTEEVQAEREAAKKEERTFVYSRRFMAETDAQAAAFESEGRQGVVRIKTPRDGTLVIDDLVRGRVEFPWANEQDHVIQRADGTCLYHLASVVDDFDFQISHVIRAEEHLSNTPRQVFIAQALGYPLPQYAHLPYVAEPGSKTKMSKRKLDKYLKNVDFKKVNDQGLKIAQAIGLTTSAETFNPVIVDFYEQVGYLPDAIINYLLLLGWSLDDKTEIFSRDAMIANFSLERVNKAPASFDPQKLVSFQERYMNALPLKQKVALVLPYLQRAGLISSPPPCDTGPRLSAVLTAAGDRIKVAGDILECREFFVADDALEYDEAAFQKRLRDAPESVALLRKFRDRLATVEPFDVPTLEAALNEFVAAEGIKVAQIIHALRVALTGKGVGFGLFDTLAILGRESSLARIDRAVAKLAAS
ncbi:MAG: glutamate--tRNA ligase [Planctomycetia bacterium]|nr:glutamate--tRNA ligase [Planctomycetia bacterium]